MKKLIEKVENLKQSLEQEQEVLEIKRLNKKIQDNKELSDLIRRYHLEQTEDLKQEIIKDPLFREYKEQETNLNLLIFKINNELKKINAKDKCSL